MIIKNNFCNIFLWGACEAVPFKNLQHLHEAAPTTSPPGAEVAATLCVLGESGRTWTERGLDLCLYVSLPSPQCLSKSQLSFVRGHALAWHIPFSAWLSDGWERTPCMAHRYLETSSFFFNTRRDWGRWDKMNSRVDRNLGKIVQITLKRGWDSSIQCVQCA